MTSRSKQNQEITNNELLAMINSISDGVMAINRHKRITFFNKAAEKITGVELNDAIGRKCFDVFGITDGECELCRTLETNRSVINHFIRITCIEGRTVPVSISTAVLKDSKGIITGAIETFRDLSQVEALRKQLESSYMFEDMIGRSQKMQDIFDLLPIIAQSESTVLIEGESGTGKELVVRAIHNASPRSGKPIVTVNSGAIPDNLLESELFGYKAGAFTDAKKDKKGRFALAEGGTLFLDEIGDISPNLQVKLLRVLQEYVYEPLGGTESIKADVRIIAATNQDLLELMKLGRFRQDLYYRINVIKIKMPPLRERMSDIPLLTDHFIGRFNHLRNKDISSITADALKILMNFDFPGNVRELENIIEHAFVLCPGGVIQPEHLPTYIHETRPIPAVEIASNIKEMEALFLTAALQRNRWSRQDTARELDINPSTLYRKIKKLGLTFPNSHTESESSSD